MRRTLLALTAVMPAFGAAHATDLLSTMQFPDFAGFSSRQEYAGSFSPMPTGRDDFLTKASLGGPTMPGRMRYLFREAPVRSTTHHSPGTFGLSSSGPLDMTDGLARLARPLVPCADLYPHVD